MKLVLVSGAVLTLVGGTAVSVQPVAPDHRAGRRWVKVDNENFAEGSPTTGLIYQIIGRH